LGEKKENRRGDNHRCGKHKNANGMLIRLQKKKLSGYPPLSSSKSEAQKKKRKDGFCITEEKEGGIGTGGA
jgi:hypothetical protein